MIFFDKGRIDDFPDLHWICDISGLFQDVLKCPVTGTLFREHLHFILDPFFVSVGECPYCVLVHWNLLCILEGSFIKIFQQLSSL